MTALPQSSTSKKIIGQVLVYASSQYTAQAFGFLTALLIRRFLGPVWMGMWGALQLILSYASYAHLGTMTTVFYQGPMLRGAGKFKEAEGMERVVFVFLAVTALATSLGILAYAIFFKTHLDKEIFRGLIFTAVILLGQRLFAYHVVLLRAHKNFAALSRLVVFEACANLFLVVVVVGRYSYTGLLVTSAVLPFLCVWFLRKFVSVPLTWQWHTPSFITYLRYGFPIFVRECLVQILNSIDRLMIVAMLGFRELGIFSIALMARNYGEGVYRHFSHVLSPYLLEDLGRSDDAEHVTKFVIMPTWVLSYFMSALLGVVYITSAPLVELVIPKFSEGLLAMRIYLLTTFFTTLMTQAEVHLMAKGRRPWQWVAVSGIAVCLNAGLAYIFIRQDWGINGASWATAITSALLFLFTYVYVVMQVRTAAEVLGFLMNLALPAILCLSVLLWMETAVATGDVLLRAAAQLAIFFVVNCGLLFYINTKTKVLSMVWSVLRRK